MRTKKQYAFIGRLTRRRALGTLAGTESKYPRQARAVQQAQTERIQVFVDPTDLSSPRV
jgi:hypothetical protein